MPTREHLFSSAAGTNWSSPTNALINDGSVATFAKTQPTVTPLRLTDMSDRTYQALDAILGLTATVKLGGTGGPRGAARGVMASGATVYSSVDDAANAIDGDLGTYYGYSASANGVVRYVSVVIDLGEAKTVGHVKSTVHSESSDAPSAPLFFKSSDGVNWTAVSMSSSFPPIGAGPANIDWDSDLSGGPHSARFWRIEHQDGGVGEDSMPQVRNFRLYQTGGSTEVVRTIAMKERIEVALTRDGTNAFGSWKQIEVDAGGGTYVLGNASDLWGNAEIFGQDLLLSTFGTLARRKALEDGNEVATDRLVDFVKLSSGYDVWVYNNMATRPAERQLCLLGKETTPGDAAAPTIRLKAAKLPFSVQPTVEDLRQQGDLLPADHVTIFEKSESPVEGYATYDELGLLFASVFGKPSTSLVESGAYRHEFVMDTRGPSNPQTYNREYGDVNHAERVSYVLVDALGLDWDRGKMISLSGHAHGKKMVDNLAGVTAGVNAVQTLTITGTPTGGTYKLRWNGQETSALAYNADAAAIDAALEALSNIGAGDVSVSGTGPFTVTFTGALAGKAQPIIELSNNSLTGGSSPSVTIAITTLGGYTEHKCVPVLPGHNTNYYATTLAGLAAGKLSKAVTGNVAVGGRYDVVTWLDAANPEFSEHGETAMTLVGKIMVNADSGAAAIRADVNRATAKYLRLEFEGGIVAGATKYRLTIDMAVKVRQAGQLSNQGVVYAQEFEFGSVFDPAWGRAAQIVLVNDVASY